MARAQKPPIEQLVALAQQIEPARYAEDVGYDVRKLAMLARRVLATDAAQNAEVSVYAIEALSDQAVSPPGPPTSRASDAHLLRSLNGPSDSAKELSRNGLSIVSLGIADNGLTRVVAAGGELTAPVVEAESVFSDRLLRKWSRTYPYQYADAADNAFYTSTSGLGVTELPARGVVVASTDLQGFPPNLFQVDRELAGRDRRLAAAPSLAWLRAARQTPFVGDGRIISWIPTAAPEEGTSVLAIVADQLSAAIAHYGVIGTSASSPPEGIAGADLLIVAAHGGVGEGNGYFRVVRDDLQLAIGSSSLANAFSGIGCVVLFVCSGGRLDKDPRAHTTIGLVKQLLDNGCRAVIAPPWPLYMNVPAYWLPTFLADWKAGNAVIDSCFNANASVRSSLGEDPVHCLAMTVYGDPLLAKTAL